VASVALTLRMDPSSVAPCQLRWSNAVRRDPISNSRALRTPRAVLFVVIDLGRIVRETIRRAD
jgi:hypothetical protein